eukprot:4701640-Pyramimonas_sp.AAC.1
MPQIFPWRAVGLTENQSDLRALSCGSIVMRRWLNTLAMALPQPSDAQWARKRGVSVAHLNGLPTVHKQMQVRDKTCPAPTTPSVMKWGELGCWPQ